MPTISSNFQLSGLHCESCKKITEKRVQKIEGVITAETNLQTGELRLKSQRQITKQEIIDALAGTDYLVKLVK